MLCISLEDINHVLLTVLHSPIYYIIIIIIIIISFYNVSPALPKVHAPGFSTLEYCTETMKIFRVCICLYVYACV